MATFSKIDGAEPSTVTFTLATVTQDRGGVIQHQEIVTLGGTESTLAVAAVLAAAPASTAWALAVREVGPVIVRQSTAADLNVTVAGYSTTVNISSLAGPVIVRSSKADALVTVYQSTAADLNVTVAGYVAPSTIVTVAAFGAGLLSSAVVAGNSSALTVRNVWSSTNTDQPVSAAQAGTWNIGTVTAVSSLAGAVIARSSKADMLVTAYQSSAADFNVTVAGYSTTVNISSLAGPVICRSSKADMLVTVYQSTASELKATVTPDSTAWSVLARNTTSSGGAIEGSTTAPAGGVIGIHVREALQDLLSTRAVITSSNSTALYTLVSSAAGLKHKVYAYSITSTETTPSTIIFMSSNATDRWAVSFGSGSSGISGANFSVSPPAYLFKTDAANALRCLIEKAASTRCDVTLSIGYFSEP